MASITGPIPLAADADQAWATIADPWRVNELLTFLGPVTVADGQQTCSLGEQGTLHELLVNNGTRELA